MIARLTRRRNLEQSFAVATMLLVCLVIGATMVVVHDRVAAAPTKIRGLRIELDGERAPIAEVQEVQAPAVGFLELIVERRGARAAMIEAVIAATQRSRELAGRG